MAFIIQSKECGTFIELAETLVDAKKIVKDYEEVDEENGEYTEDFYEIVESNYLVTNNTLFNNKVADLDVDKKWKNISITLHDGKVINSCGEHSSKDFIVDYGFELI